MTARLTDPIPPNDRYGEEVQAYEAHTARLLVCAKVDFLRTLSAILFCALGTAIIVLLK